MLNYINPLNLLRSQEENQDIKRQKEIIAIKPQAQKLPHPRQGAVFPEENWVKLQVEQNGKLINLQTYRFQQNIEKFKKPLGIVIIFHGYYNYCNTGAHIAKYLSEQGYISVGFDYRGHGKSGGVRALYENEKTQISDSKLFIRQVEKCYPDLELFLLGQSLGGQTCFLLGIEDPQKYSGIILFAPAIYDMTEHAKLDKKACKIVGKLMPQKPLIEQGQEGGTSRNPQVNIEVLQDPLMHNGKIIPSAINEILKVSNKCQNMFSEFYNPFLIIQGGVDKWIDPKVCSELMKQSPSQDKSFLFYQEVWHNIWAEQEINDIIPKVANWIKLRTKNVNN